MPTFDGRTVMKNLTMLKAGFSPSDGAQRLILSQVKYWALGNEVWGPWQVAASTKEQYAHKAFQWAKALKLLDPTIQLILCGETGFSGSGQHWDAHVLNATIKNADHGLGGSGPKSLIDMHSLHLYTASKEHIPNVLGKRATTSSPHCR